MKNSKRLGVFILLLFLTACGLGTDSLPSDGLTGAVGVATRTPKAQSADSAYPQTDVFDLRCQGEKVAGQTFALVHFQVENVQSASNFIDDWAQNSAALWLNVGEDLRDYAGAIRCEGSGESMVLAAPDASIGKAYDLNPNDLSLVDWLLEQKFSELTVTLDNGQSRTRNDVSLIGLVANQPLGILSQNENITEFATTVQCQGRRIPDSDLAEVAVQIAMPDGTQVTSYGLFSTSGMGTELKDTFSCSGEGQVTAVSTTTDGQDLSLAQIEVQDLTIEGPNGESVVMSGGTTMFSSLYFEDSVRTVWETVVMSGGSTMLSEYYEGTVATGGLLVVPVEITSCWAVFEPNNANVRIGMQVQPQASIFETGDTAPPYFYGGGSAFFDEADALFADGFEATCEGMGELTAVPIHTDEHGRTQWLASVDLSDAVWKAPAGQEVAEFFSENGYRSLMLMDTSEDVKVPDTAVAKAYDLNPNDLSVAEFRCESEFVASDPDNGDAVDGEARKRPSRAIMFETLMESGETITGSGIMSVVLDNGSGMLPQNEAFTCIGVGELQFQSAQIGIGEQPVCLAEYQIPELTVQTESGEMSKFENVKVLGFCYQK